MRVPAMRMDLFGVVHTKYCLNQQRVLSMGVRNIGSNSSGLFHNTLVQSTPQLDGGLSSANASSLVTSTDSATSRAQGDERLAKESIGFSGAGIKIGTPAGK